jgi:hypothetical protein
MLCIQLYKNLNLCITDFITNLQFIIISHFIIFMRFFIIIIIIIISISIPTSTSTSIFNFSFNLKYFLFFNRYFIIFY